MNNVKKCQKKISIQNVKTTKLQEEKERLNDSLIYYENLNKCANYIKNNATIYNSRIDMMNNMWNQLKSLKKESIQYTFAKEQIDVVKEKLNKKKSLYETLKKNYDEIKEKKNTSESFKTKNFCH